MRTKQAVFHFTQHTSENEKFQVGSPLPKGLFFATQCLTLVKGNGVVINASIKPIQLWPDLSIKWISIEGVLNIAMQAKEQLYVSFSHSSKALKRPDWVKKENNHLLINTNDTTLLLKTDKFIEASLNNDIALSANIDIRTQELINNSQVTKVETQYEVLFNSLQQPLLCKIKQTGDLLLSDSKPNSDQLALQSNTGVSSINSQAKDANRIKVIANIVVYFADTSIFVNLCVHNSNAIVHHDGQWDLGNEHSVIVKRFALDIHYHAEQAQVQFAREQQPTHFSQLDLVQYSSAGDNWNSENHVTSNNEVNLKHKGAKGSLTAVSKAASEDIDKNKSEHKILELLRPSPFIKVNIKDRELRILPQHFWQKYPAGVSSNNTHTIIDYAEQRSECQVELQPGEMKSHDLAFSYSNNSLNFDSAATCLIINNHYVLSPDNIEQSKATPFINKHLCEHPLMQIINGEGNVNWLNKRELVDEYGWRNFGDLYADHEAAEHKSKGIFVSHYNNQYDPLFGFLKQWLLTQNTDFKMLADDLFDHLIHIDIYHTSSDKPEYNQGLFWHTDHYVSAKTATHRTYSQLQDTNVYMDHAGGGGPGAHHCYSSGLALYYLMTGDERAKQATVGLAQWMTSIYEGDSTLLGIILRAKNANYITIPFTNKPLFGKGTGVVRNIFNNSYPLDRGTGNYINVLLDSFETTMQKSYIDQAERIIVNTIDKHDDISKRNFDDIENTWFYVVFLQAVAKYLAIVSQQISLESSGFIDLSRVQDIYDAFIHYVKYMAAREQHFLANKEVLEYPNDTWTGQDLRKVHVLLCGYELSHNHQMLSKALQLSQVIYPALLASEERSYTRIQALIMQNYVSQESVAGSFGDLTAILAKHNQTSPLKVKSTRHRVNRSYLTRCVRFLKSYSFKHEIDMLCVRVPAVKKALNR